MKTTGKNWRELIEGLRDISGRVSRRPLHIGEVHPLLHDNLILCNLFQDSPETSDDHLVHYTSWENALNMFRKKKNKKKKPVLRMYNYEQSNDPDEGGIRPEEWKEAERIVDSIDRNRDGDDGENNFEYSGNMYGCSFSSGGRGVEDDLTYWRMYGNDGEGCSLKITLPSARRQASPSVDKYEIFRVRYRDRDSSERKDWEKKDDEKIAVRLCELFTVCAKIVNAANGEYPIEEANIAKRLREIVRICYYLVKHKNYAGEQEWRMIKVAPETKEIRFDTTAGKLVRRYIKGPGLEEILSSASVITIGPTVPNRGAARAYIEHLAQTEHGIRHVKVKNSRQTYRRWA